MLNVLFYGASVTHQTGSSGYFQNLDKDFFQSDRMSYPSSQFYNAGFYNAHKIKNLSNKPDLVFFEWSTTGETQFDLDKLNYFINELIRNNILPIFLILPKKSTFKNNRISDVQLYEFNKNLSIPLLDLRYLLTDQNMDDLLRDDVHTTELGAKLYAECIVQFITLNSKSALDCKILENAPAFNIAHHDVDLNLCENQTLIFSYNSINLKKEIAVSLIKGPFSPVIEYLSDGNVIGEHCFFDPWCYYERENFDTLVPEFIFEKLTSNSIGIRISNKSPDFTITKTKEVFIVPKKLLLKSIYTSGLDNLTWVLN